MKRLQEIIEDTQIELEIFERDEQLYRNWSETNTKKRVLELLLGNKEKERLSSRITSVISLRLYFKSGLLKTYLHFYFS